jgi:hypothetical protein
MPLEIMSPHSRPSLRRWHRHGSNWDSERRFRDAIEVRPGSIASQLSRTRLQHVSGETQNQT